MVVVVRASWAPMRFTMATHPHGLRLNRNVQSRVETSCDESKAQQLWGLVIQGLQRDSRILDGYRRY